MLLTNGISNNSQARGVYDTRSRHDHALQLIPQLHIRLLPTLRAHPTRLVRSCVVSEHESIYGACAVEVAVCTRVMAVHLSCVMSTSPAAVRGRIYPEAQKEERFLLVNPRERASVVGSRVALSMSVGTADGRINARRRPSACDKD